MRIGIDLGGTKTEGVLLGPRGEEYLRRRCRTPVTRGYEAILRTIADLVFELAADLKDDFTVGVCTPGALSQSSGTLKNANTTCMIGKPILPDLERILNRPVRLENDANCFALAEALDGAGQDADCVFGIILGTGVGGGITVRQRLLPGRHHIAGEWGHNILESDGPPCYCGRRGCVETFLSGPGLVADYARGGGENSLDAARVAARATAGDAVAAAALDRYLDRFGRALAGVINILDPDVVILGGGLSNITRLYLDGPDHVARYIFNEDFRTPILQNHHGDSAGVLGAAQLWPPPD